MLSRTHVLSGLAAACSTLPLLPADHPATTAGWITAVAGAAMLPDLDHPDSTASRTWGHTTRTLARRISSVSGGHRGATHDILTAPAVAAALGGIAAVHPVLSGGLLTFLTGLALCGLGLRRSRRTLTVAVALGAAVAITASGFGWLPAALALGVATHILGDAITNNSIPVPVTWLRADGARRLGRSPLRTGSRLERWAVAPTFLICSVVAIAVTYLM